MCATLLYITCKGKGKAQKLRINGDAYAIQHMQCIDTVSMTHRRRCAVDASTTHRHTYTKHRQRIANTSVTHQRERERERERSTTKQHPGHTKRLYLVEPARERDRVGHRAHRAGGTQQAKRDRWQSAQTSWARWLRAMRGPQPASQPVSQSHWSHLLPGEEEPLKPPATVVWKWPQSTIAADRGPCLGCWGEVRWGW